MEGWIQWAVGIAVSLETTVVIGMLAAFGKLSNKQSTDVKTLHDKIEGVKDTYVRRDDFAAFRVDLKEQLQRIEDKQDRIITQTKPH